MKHTCPSCNRGQIVDLKTRGRRMPYRNIPDLEVPAEVAIPTCDSCGEQWLDASASARLDDALKSAYQAALASKVEAALARLIGAGITQQQLERLLGLSVGYISKVKSGKETSPQLVAALMSLAADPVARIGELKEFWRTLPPVVALDESRTISTVIPDSQVVDLRHFKQKSRSTQTAETANPDGHPQRRAIGS